MNYFHTKFDVKFSFYFKLFQTIITYKSLHTVTSSLYNSFIMFPLLFQVQQISKMISFSVIHRTPENCPYDLRPAPPFLMQASQRNPKQETWFTFTVIFLHCDHINHRNIHQRSHVIFIVTMAYNWMPENCISHFKKQKSYPKILLRCVESRHGVKKEVTRFLLHIQRDWRLGI